MTLHDQVEAEARHDWIDQRPPRERPDYGEPTCQTLGCILAADHPGDHQARDGYEWPNTQEPT